MLKRGRERVGMNFRLTYRFNNRSRDSDGDARLWVSLLRFVRVYWH
jgi:hypothetical protein